MVRTYSERNFKYTDTNVFECVCNVGGKDVLVMTANIADSQVYDIHISVLDHHSYRLPFPEVLREEKTFLSALQTYLSGYNIQYLNDRSSSDTLSIF